MNQTGPGSLPGIRAAPASAYLANKHSLRIGSEALRQLMMSQGLYWVRRPAKGEVQQWRPRRFGQAKRCSSLRHWTGRRTVDGERERWSSRYPYRVHRVA